ncbi:MAG: hypothetical protein ACTHK4_12910 [Mycobacteriales bacterium]
MTGAGAVGERVLASGDSAFGAGFLAFLIVLALAVGSFFLFRSISRHLRKVPSSFDPPPPDEDTK